MKTAETRKQERLESKARRAAKRAGLCVVKSRRRLSAYNAGQFMLVDPFSNRVVRGEKFDLSPQEVIDHCS